MSRNKRTSELTPDQLLRRRIAGRLHAQEYRRRNKYKNAYHCFILWYRHDPMVMVKEIEPSFETYVKLRKLAPTDTISRTYVGDIFSKKYMNDYITYNILIDILKQMVVKHGPRKFHTIINLVAKTYLTQIQSLTVGIITRLLAKIHLGYL